MSDTKYLLPTSGLTRYCYNNYRKGIAKVNKNSVYILYNIIIFSYIYFFFIIL